MGRAVAEWLNREHSERPNSPAAFLIEVLIVLGRREREAGASAEDALSGAFEKGFIAQVLPAKQVREDAPVMEVLKEALQKRSCLPVKMRAELRRHGTRLKFELIPENKDSEMLYRFGQLVNSGNASRLLRCPNCRKYWYCEGRTDKKACSNSCKVALWQKTPAGREMRAAYMRELRAKKKRLWEAKQVGRKLKRGRNVHVSLKKGE